MIAEDKKTVESQVLEKVGLEMLRATLLKSQRQSDQYRKLQTAHNRSLRSARRLHAMLSDLRALVERGLEAASAGSAYAGPADTDPSPRELRALREDFAAWHVTHDVPTLAQRRRRAFEKRMAAR